MTNHQLISKIKQLSQIQPSKTWKEALREELIFKADKVYRLNKKEERGEINLSYRLIEGFNLKLAVITVSILITLFGGSIFTVRAAKNSLPGQFLYPIKIAVEKTRVLLATKQGNKVKLEVEFASQRLEELGQMVQNQEAEKIVEGVSNFQNKIDSIGLALQELKKNDKIVEVAKIVDNKTVEFENILEATQEKLPLDLKPVIEKVDEINTQALKVMVENVTSSLSPDSLQSEKQREILVRVEDKIKRIEEKIENPEAKEILDRAREQLNKQSLFMALEIVEEARKLEKDATLIVGPEEETAALEVSETQTAVEEQKSVEILKQGDIKTKEQKFKNKETEKIDESGVKADFRGDLLLEPEKGVFGGLLKAESL